jgi:hypothetical protein
MVENELQTSNTIFEKAFDFLDEIIKPPLKEVGGLLSDQVRFWRYKNQINIIEKARSYLKSKNLETRKVPLKVLASLLDYSSYEEDENLINMWAKMLANAASKDNPIDCHPIFPIILNQLSPIEAKVLDSIFEKLAPKFKKEVIPLDELSFIRSELFSDFQNITNFESIFIINNLSRLNLIDKEFTIDEKYCFTMLGNTFMLQVKTLQKYSKE